MIVASDGVWEYMTNKEVLNVTLPHYLKGKLDQAAESLILSATNAWKRVI